MPQLSVVIVSYETRAYLQRCLRAVDGRGHEVLVVDNASTDGSAEAVRRDFPAVQVLGLERNLGYGAAANDGIRVARGSYVLLLNPDAWPADEDAIPRLLSSAETQPDAGVLGPRLLGPDGSPQASLVGVPTRWWTGTPAVSAAPPGLLGRLFLRARPRGEVFLVGAALLLRRAALDDVGGFDPDFFMFGEEVDLCVRAQRRGWRVQHCPESTFVHVGGAAARRDWPAMYREQVRGHLRLLAKHDGLDSAERARRFLGAALRIRARLARDEARALYRETVSWLASGDARHLLADPGRRPPDRMEASGDRTSRSAG